MRAFLLFLILLPAALKGAVLKTIELRDGTFYIRVSDRVPYKVAYDRGKAIIWVRLKNTTRSPTLPQAFEGKGIVDEVWIYQTTKTICDIFFFLKRQDIDYSYTFSPKTMSLVIRVRWKEKAVKKKRKRKKKVVKALKKKPKKIEEKKKKGKKVEKKKELTPDLELLENARKLVKMRDYETALSYLNTFFKNYPTSKYYPDAYYLLGEIYLILGKKSLEGKKYSLLAIDTFRNFVNYYSFHPKAKEAYVKLAEAYMQIKFYPEAIGILEFVLNTYKGTDVEEYALIAKAKALFLSKRYLDAIETYKLFIKKFPKSKYIPEAYYGLASCYYKLGYYRKALLAFKKAYKRWPTFVTKNPEYLFYMGDTYYRLGKFKRAREYFMYIITYAFRSPFAPKALVKVGDTYVQEGNIQKALEAYSEVLRKYPKTEGEIIATIRMADLGVTTKAERILRRKVVTFSRKIFKIVPTRPSKKKVKVKKVFYFEPYLNPIDAYQDLLKRGLKYPLNQIVSIKLGVGYLTFKNYQKALSVFSSFLKNYPFSRFKDVAKNYLVDALKLDIKDGYRRGEYWRIAKDEMDFKKYLFAVDDPFVFKCVGEAYLNLGLYNKSLDYMVLSASLDKEENLSKILLRIGELLYMRGDYHRSIEFCSMVLERTESSPEMLLAKNIMGLSYYMLERFKDASDTFSSLEEEGFSFPLFSLYAYAVSSAKLGRFKKAAALLNTLMGRYVIKKGEKVPSYIREAYLLLPFYELKGGFGNPKRDLYVFLKTFPSSNETAFAKFALSILEKGSKRISILKELGNGTGPYSTFSKGLLEFISFKEKARKVSER